MNGPEDRWESGSEFHALPGGAAPAEQPWGTAATYHGTGRDALRGLMADGREHRGWRRLWVPSYFCQEVIASILQEGLTILPYRAGPEEAQPDLEAIPLVPGDAVLRVNLFGLQALGPLAGWRARGVEVIEDHTHDPWSERAWSSDADWCFASLRKTLPVAEGGVAWSPAGRALPPQPPLTPERRLASLAKFAAMVLKRDYLQGGAVAKEVFRSLAVAGEAGMGEGPPSGMTPWSRMAMEAMPHAAWREQRRRNHGTCVAALGDLPGVQVLRGAGASCPFFVVLCFERPEWRDRVKAELVAARIYPGSHWPMEPPAIAGIPADHVALSQRILTLHCDMRYDARHMERVAGAVSRAVRGALQSSSAATP